MLDDHAKDDLLSRGYSRRQLGRVAALVGAGATMATAFRPAFGQAQAARSVPGAIQIGANECWTGPFAAGADAATQIVLRGNRYDPDDEQGKLIKTVSVVEKVPESRILAWPGSGDPLMRSVVSFCSPQKGLVTADPTYEAAWRAAGWLKAPLVKVSNAPGQGADVRKMLAANPNAGLYYICSPNNPTGVVTPLADIEWLVKNKPADAVVLVDEAYIHWSDASSAAPLAATRDDVVVMRTFSKLFGMAGIRLGLTFASPTLHARMMRYDGQQVTGNLPITAMACGRASYTQFEAMKARRAEMIAVREETLAHLAKRNVAFHPNSQANMFMVDWKTKSAKDMQAAFLQQKIQIGRSWPIWPTVSRVTVGSADEMKAFCVALDKIVVA